MTHPSAPAPELTPQQVMSVKFIWIAVCFAAPLIIAIVMLQAVANMPVQSVALPSREILMTGLGVLGVVTLLIARHVRITHRVPATRVAPSASQPPALAQLHANCLLALGFLDAPFMIAVGLYMVGREPMLLAVGAAPVLIGGVLFFPDPQREVREIAAK